MKLVINEFRRFRMLVVGIVVGLGVSSTYGFSIFTEHLKSKYDLDQSDITTISTVANVFGYCSFLLGMIFDAFGPKIQICISGSLATLGLILYGLTFDDKISPSSSGNAVTVFSVFSAIWFLGCPSMDMGSVIPLLMHFPLERGYTVSIQKTFTGLGTSILMAYFNAYFRPKDGHPGKYAAYSYFLGCQMVLCAACGAVFNEMPAYAPCDWVRARMSEEELEEGKATMKVYLRQHAPLRRFVVGITIVLLLLFHITFSSIYGAYHTIPSGGYYAIWVVAIILVISFSLMAVPIQALGRFPVIKYYTKYPMIGIVEDDDEDGDDGQAAGDSEPIESASVPDVRELLLSDSSPMPTSVSGDPQYKGSFWSHLLTVEIWLLWLCFFSMWGTGTVLIFNSAQIYRSKNWGTYEASKQALYVALIAVGSATGRISAGAFDIFVTRRRAAGTKDILITFFLPLSSTLLGLCFLLVILVPADVIFIPFIVGAMGNGLGWGLSALTVRVMYEADLGKHYNFLWSSGIAATVGLNRFMFGEMFDHQADKAGTSPYCNKPACVRNQMWILLGCNAMSTIAAVLLNWRFSSFTRAELARQADQSQAEQAPEDAPMAYKTAQVEDGQIEEEEAEVDAADARQ